MNSNPSAVGGEETKEKGLHEIRLDILESRLNDYFPYGTEAEMLTRHKYGKVLFKALELAIKRGMEGQVKILSSFLCQDGGHPMLTLTGIILKDVQSITEKF